MVRGLCAWRYSGLSKILWSEALIGGGIVELPVFP